jgi:hypothetical protein
LKVLFDQNAPRPLARFLTKHVVIRAAELGWEELKNGDLIRSAESAGFGCMITADKNLAYQQNLEDRKLALVILPIGRWPQLKPYIESVLLTMA